MTRFMLLVTSALFGALLVVPAGAEDPPKKLTPDERKELEAKRGEHNKAGYEAYQASKFADSAKAYAAALELDRRLYPKDEFPDGHSKLAASINNLAQVSQTLGDYPAAEALYQEALEMRRHLHKGDHPDTATSLSNLAYVYGARANYAAAEPLAREALEMRRRLNKGDHALTSLALSHLGLVHFAQGKYAAAETLFTEATEMDKRVYNGDHPQVATSLNNLAAVYQTQGKTVAAEQMLTAVLEMRKRLFKGDHPHVAASLNNLASLYQAQGKLAAAEVLFVQTLEMRKRLFKGDHPDTAGAQHNLAAVYQAQGKYVVAESLYVEALDTYKRLFKGDHPSVALGINNLAELYRVTGSHAEAEPLFTAALEMRTRLFKGDHPTVATSLNNLALVYTAQNKDADAERLYKEALEMRRRLYKRDHPDIANALGNLASLYEAQGKYADADPLHRAALEMRRALHKGDHPEVAKALGHLGLLRLGEGKHAEAEARLREALLMSRRLIAAFAKQKAEGEALTLSAATPQYRDGFLSAARRPGADPTVAFADVWASKGVIARVYEQRQQQARASDPRAANLLAELADARRRRAELLLAPDPKDPATRQKRDDDLKALTARAAELDQLIRPLLPVLARADKLNEAAATDLQKALPADAAVVDFVRYLHFEFDAAKPGFAGEKRTFRYLAFVVTRDRVAWADLDDAESVDAAVGAWRNAITGREEVPPALPARVRALVWDKVRKELPATTKAVYLCPDAALCRVPWGALPGDKPGTIVLDDFAVATIPHAPFLLDKLWKQDPAKDAPTGALVVGGVKYDADAPAPGAVATRGDPLSGSPLLKPGAKLGWSFLPGTAVEATGVAGAASAKKLPVTALKGDAATPAAVLSALPKAKYAHLATHGFFADPSFRSVFQLDPKDFETRGGERVGRAANSPLVMTGLVFAGANNEKVPGRGIVTGEALIDLDLSGLELAVLSACETGLGDVAGGEGTFGLQRAFHYAGTRDVVASLWKVPDQSTAALMALFYRNLWEKNLSPMEALRQAQLEVYRNPAKIAELANGFRGKFEEVPGMGAEAVKPPKDGTAHPLLWAAFTLSGPGR